MAKVVVGKDEHYVWTPSLDKPKDKSSSQRVVEVDDATARRWKSAQRKWEQVTAEIEGLIDYLDSREGD